MASNQRPEFSVLKNAYDIFMNLGSQRKASKALDIPRSTLQDWLRFYKEEVDDGGCSDAYEPPRMKILLLDIETSPNVAHVWGLFKANVSLSQLMDSSYTMCFAAKWYGEDEIFFSSVYHDGNKKMLTKLWGMLNSADAVVHYNGTKFDIPTCNKEFILNKMTPPNPYHQIDLLKVAKDRFRFPSNKLDYVAKALGVGQKVKHIGHELWVQCMNDNDESWCQMKEYNIGDVVVLEKVYERMLPWIKNHPNHGLFIDSDRPVCPNCGSTAVQKKGVETTQTLTYQRYRCTSCGTPIRSRYTIDHLEKRRNILTQSKL